MSGPNPPGSEGSDLPGQEPGNQPTSDQSSAPATGETESYSQAYSAPESEQFTSGPYVPADSSLYDYDSYEPATELVEQEKPPRWPWIVGVAAIIAAIVLVASVSVLVTRTDTDNLATPATSTTTPPPVQDEITTTTPPPPPPPPPPTTEEPPPPPPETVTVTQEPPPPPAPAPTEAPPPPPATTAAPPPPPTTTTPPGPRQVTYSVTGTKAPFDQITITYTDASGMRRTLSNVYIPWTITLTPISASDVGSIEASSLLRLSKLNCKVTASDGTVLSANENNQPQVNC